MILPAMCFVTLLHGFTPRLGVYVMNVSTTICFLFEEMFIPVKVLTVFKLVLLLFIVMTGKAPYFLRRRD